MAVPCLASNSAAHPWVVQKFGGTSVGKFPDKVGSVRVLMAVFWALVLVMHGAVMPSCGCHISRSRL